jgi:hypothetical protein
MRFGDSLVRFLAGRAIRRRAAAPSTQSDITSINFSPLRSYAAA